jgi:hypothetical protein
MSVWIKLALLHILALVIWTLALKYHWTYILFSLLENEVLEIYKQTIFVLIWYIDMNCPGILLNTDCD